MLHKFRKWLTRLRQIFSPKRNELYNSARLDPCSYSVIDSSKKDEADQYFESLRKAIYTGLDQDRKVERSSVLPPKLFTERGKLESGRSYFFLKPKDEPGWLFERSGPGWTISRCEKISEQNLFLREREAWDIVTLYSPHLRHSSLRVKSKRAGDDVLSFPVYQKMMVDAVISASADREG